MGNAHYQTNIRNSKKDKDSAIPKAETRKNIMKKIKYLIQGNL